MFKSQFKIVLSFKYFKKKPKHVEKLWRSLQSLDMKDGILTFKQKIKLYKDLKDFFQRADLKNHPMGNKEIENLIVKLKMWGKELRVRQLYYDT